MPTWRPIALRWLAFESGNFVNFDLYRPTQVSALAVVHPTGVDGCPHAADDVGPAEAERRAAPEYSLVRSVGMAAGSSELIETFKDASSILPSAGSSVPNWMQLTDQQPVKCRPLSRARAASAGSLTTP